MKTLLDRIISGNYGLFFEADPPPANPPADPPPSDPPPGLPPKDAEPPGLPPKDPNAPPPEVVTYDFEADTAGLKGIDLKGEKILGKFNGVEDLLKSYGELESFKGKKVEDFIKEAGYFAPEEYDFGDHGKEWDEETRGAVVESFKTMKLTQEQATAALPIVMDLGQELATALGTQELMNEWGLTGEAFKAKEAQVAKWAGENIPDDVYSALEKLGAGGMIAAEAMMRSNQERPLWTGADAGVDLADISQKITDVEAKMKGMTPGSAEYKALEKQRIELYRKKNPPKA